MEFCEVLSCCMPQLAFPEALSECAYDLFCPMEPITARVQEAWKRFLVALLLSLATGCFLFFTHIVPWVGIVLIPALLVLSATAYVIYAGIFEFEIPQEISGSLPPALTRSEESSLVPQEAFFSQDMSLRETAPQGPPYLPLEIPLEEMVDSRQEVLLEIRDEFTSLSSLLPSEFSLEFALTNLDKIQEPPMSIDCFEEIENLFTEVSLPLIQQAIEEPSDIQSRPSLKEEISFEDIEEDTDFSFEEVLLPIEYNDQEAWSTVVTFIPQTRPPLTGVTPYESFEALIAKELERRTRQNKLEVKAKEIKMRKEQIATSACNRDDFKASVTLSEQICRSYNLPSQVSFEIRHEFLKNSPMNGSCYLDKKGETSSLFSAISASGDRSVDRLQMARRVVYEKTDKTICYSGRPDTFKKAKEQAEMIFLNELKNKREIPYSDGIYTLTYVVVSLMDANAFNKEEGKLFQNEMRALELLEKDVHQIKDANENICQVRLRPILLTKQMNIFGNLEKLLPAKVSGRKNAQKVNQEAMKKLEEFLDDQKLELQRSSLAQDVFIRLSQKESAKLNAEEFVVLVTLLADFLDIPLVVHCKSSKDRTAIAIAIACALKEWCNQELEVPKKDGVYHPELLVLNPLFKELFCANFLMGLQVTKYGMSFSGTLGNETFEDDKMGFNMHTGLLQNPVLTRLMPERYLKHAGVIEKLMHEKVMNGKSSFIRRTNFLFNKEAYERRHS